MSYFSEFTYLAASILFIFGLKGLSHPDTARRGMNMAALGMLMAIVGTLVRHEIVRYEWIIAGLIIGSIIGAAMKSSGLMTEWFSAAAPSTNAATMNISKLKTGFLLYGHRTRIQNLRICYRSPVRDGLSIVSAD